MVNLIEEWGKWARHQGYESPSTPLFKLMQENGCFERGDVSAPCIADDEALAVDMAMARLRRDSLLLFDVLYAKNVLSWSYRRIAKEYMTPLEYPHQIGMRDDNPKKRFVNHTTVIKLADVGETMIYRWL